MPSRPSRSGPASADGLTIFDILSHWATNDHPSFASEPRPRSESRSDNFKTTTRRSNGASGRQEIIDLTISDDDNGDTNFRDRPYNSLQPPRTRASPISSRRLPPQRLPSNSRRALASDKSHNMAPTAPAAQGRRASSISSNPSHNIARDSRIFIKDSQSSAREPERSQLEVYTHSNAPPTPRAHQSVPGSPNTLPFCPAQHEPAPSTLARRRSQSRFSSEAQSNLERSDEKRKTPPSGHGDDPRSKRQRRISKKKLAALTSIPTTANAMAILKPLLEEFNRERDEIAAALLQQQSTRLARLATRRTPASAFDDYGTLVQSASDEDVFITQTTYEADGAKSTIMLEEQSFAKLFKARYTKAPPFKHYVKTSANIVTRNDAVLPAYPHANMLGDSGATDDAQMRFEKVLRDTYTEGNPETRRITVPGSRQAIHLSHVIESFLTQIDLTQTDLLRYFVANESTHPWLFTSHSKPDCFANNESWDAFRRRDGTSKRMANDLKKLYREVFEKEQHRLWQALARIESATKGHSRISHKEPIDELAIPKITLIAVACEAFNRCTGFPLWLFTPRVIAEPVQVGTSGSADNFKRRWELECLVCRAVNCLSHGRFLEESDSENELVNCSTSVNRKERFSFDPKPLLDVCPCLQQQGIGLIPCVKLHKDSFRPDHEDACDSQCFLSSSKYEYNRNEQALKAVQRQLAGSCWDERAPCVLAPVVQLSCAKTYALIYEVIERAIANRTPLEILQQHGLEKDLPRSQSEAGARRAKKLEEPKGAERVHFLPCKHPGLRCDQSKCTCFKNNVSCEKMCGCAVDCARRFQGCDCETTGRICWNNPDCPCHQRDRECDPDLCRTCKAHKVLDPRNRADENIQKGHCGNVSLQHGRQKRTIAGKSQVPGFGLFAGEHIKKFEFIGEYKGEVVSKGEADRRAEQYHQSKLSYFFNLTRDLDIDGTNVGNKLRFANHQDKPNVFPRVLLCNGNNRVGFWACRDIKAGEEMFIDYGETWKEEQKGHFVDLDLDGRKKRPLKASNSKLERKGKSKRAAEGDGAVESDGADDRSSGSQWSGADGEGDGRDGDDELEADDGRDGDGDDEQSDTLSRRRVGRLRKPTRKAQDLSMRSVARRAWRGRR